MSFLKVPIKIIILYLHVKLSILIRVENPQNSNVPTHQPKTVLFFETKDLKYNGPEFPRTLNQNYNLKLYKM